MAQHPPSGHMMAPPGGAPFGAPPPGAPGMMMPPPGGMMGMPPQQPPQPPPQGVPPRRPVELFLPNNTLYIQNLDEKIKEKDLKTKLKAIFKQFGNILQIVAMKSYSRRGQAFVVFDSVQAATKALEMQSYPLTPEKPMRINYAKTKSDIIARKDNTYTPRAKRPLPPKPTLPQEEQAKRLRMEDDETSTAAPPAQPYGAADTGFQQQNPPYNPYGGPPQPPPVSNQPQAGAYGAPPPFGAPPAPPPPQQQASAGEPREEEVPNKILFLTGLPDDATDNMLSMLFQQFPGFKEVRLVPGRADIAFVEYDTDMQAFEARSKLNGFKIKGDIGLNVNFAKK
eukprot:m.214744 g.214744  ORF g.214744 m.214744 type:complete len:339 (+) comp19077_c0_seq2:126-1142(+)